MKKIVVYGMSIFFAVACISACGKKQESTSEVQKPKSDKAIPQFKFEDDSYDPNFKIPAPKKKLANYSPEGSPTRAIQDLDDMLDSYVTNPKTPEEQKYNTQLKASIIHGTFEIRELCRMALDKNWEMRTAEEQDYFVKLMTRLLEKKAVFSKEQGQKGSGDSGGKSTTPYKITYEGEQFLDAEKSKAEVKSSVLIPSQSLRIELNYKLKKAGNEWKAFDVIVDGASLLDNYKYQFDKIISKDGYPELVRRMESKLQAIESKNS